MSYITVPVLGTRSLALIPKTQHLVLVLVSFSLDHIPCMWAVSCLRSLVKVPFLYPKHQPVYASFKVLSFGALVMLLDL